MSLQVIEGDRGETIREVLERALKNVDKYDGVVVLMQCSRGWIAREQMTDGVEITGDSLMETRPRRKFGQQKKEGD